MQLHGYSAVALLGIVLVGGGLAGCGGGGSTGDSTGTGTTSTTLSLRATPSTITPGQSVTLSWTSANANSVTSSTFGAANVNGSVTVRPTFSTDYAISVTGSNNRTGTARVTVTRPTPRFAVVGSGSDPEVAEIQTTLASAGTVTVQSSIPTDASSFDSLVIHDSGSIGPSDAATVRAALAANKGVVLVGFAPSKLSTGASAFTTSGDTTDTALDTSAIAGWFGGVTELDLGAESHTGSDYKATTNLSYFALPPALAAPCFLVITGVGDNQRLPHVSSGSVSAPGFRLLDEDAQTVAFAYKPAVGGRLAWMWHAQGFDPSSTSQVSSLFKTAALWSASN